MVRRWAAQALARDSNYARALVSYDRALAQFPDHVRTQEERQAAETNRRVSLERLWDEAEASLARSLDKFVGKGNWRDNPGDGAFYGPKIDIKASAR